jgi:hypothetical protein
MLSRFLMFSTICVAPAAADEIVKLPTRPGVTQSFLIVGMEGRTPEAAALLFPGSRGNIYLRVEDGRIRPSKPVRSREYARNAILPVVVDAPSDQVVLNPHFRESAAHLLDVRAVLAEVKRRYPSLPVFVVGSSSSTISAGHLALALESEIAGVVFGASVFYWHGGGHNPRPMMVAFDWGRIRIPLLFVHHLDDSCSDTPYREAARLGTRFPLITVHGGKQGHGSPCQGQSAHAFYGKEAETVDAIAAWMLGKPFAKEIR